MTDTLTELLSRRADRAPSPGDPQAAVARVAARADEQDRRRRTRLTVASGTTLVAAAVTVGIVVFAGSDGAAERHGVVAGGGRSPISTAAAARSATLTRVKPAPPVAEISLGLLPAGYRYLGLDAANAFYGPPGTSAQDSFSDGIVADVHAFAGGGDYTLTVDGKPAAYSASDGYVSVRVRYSATIDVGFQAPPAAGLTEAQALQMAASIDVRSTAEQTHG